MARKKQETALQVEIETQEEWEEMLAKEGLTVVDIYQEWAGPCKAMLANFRRMKNELGDDLLRFAVGKADTVDALERYRGRCEPCFLLFAGGVLVSQVRGANSPVILRTITEQLSIEHKVLEGNAERKEIKDPMIVDVADDKDEEEDEDDEEVEIKSGDIDKEEPLEGDTPASFQASRPDIDSGMQHKGERIIFESLPEYADDVEEEEKKKGVSVAIIKPNVVANGKVDEVIEKMKEAGIEILEQQERTLTEEEAKEFYRHAEGEEFFNDLVEFMTSGPSYVMVITKGQSGEGIIEEWRELLGPASVEDAKEHAPDSLRAKFGGEKNYINALHGSDSEETAMRELAFFFPDYMVPTVSTGATKPKKQKVQRTLALIRPDALRERKDEILAKIEEAGFRVALQKEIVLSKEQAEEFYSEHREQDYFEELTNRMSSGPLLALGLAREDAVTKWRDLLGPKEVDKAKEEAPDSFRAQFSVEDVPINQLHGSDSEETASKELQYFFPMQQTIAAIKPDAYQTKDEIMQRVREAGFHIAARKETELTKDIAEQFYSENKDKEYFSDLTEHMASGPTLFMVLSREDAVDGWRSLIGPTDPEEAKEVAPESLRAQFGKDIKANAIHGSSNPDHVNQSMKLIFGDLEFNPDGTVNQGAADKKDESKESSQDNEQDVQDEQRDEQQDRQEDKPEGEQQDDAAEKTEGEEDQEGEKKDDDKKSQDGEDRKSPEADKKSQDGEAADRKSPDQKSRDGDKKDEGEEAEKKSQGGEKDEDDKKEESQSDEKQDEDKKDDEQTQDDKKEDDKQEDDKKDDDKQDDEQKQDDKKEDEPKEDDKKGDDKKDDDQAKVDDQKDDGDKKDDEDKKDDGPKDEDKKEDDEKKDDEDKKDDEEKKDDDPKDEDKKDDDDKKGETDEQKQEDKKEDEQKAE